MPMKRIFFFFFLVIIGSIVGLLSFDTLFIYMPLQKHIDQDLTRYWREMTRGEYYLILKDMKSLPPEEWERYIRGLQPHFGYPISLNDIEKLPLSQAERNDLVNNLIIVKEGASLFHLRVPYSDKAITMGVINEFDSSLWTNVLLWSILIVMLGLMALIWAIPFWGTLKKIISAAQAFGRGEFAARAKIFRQSMLAPLANTFNDMAGRIQQLISSHKELTQAVSHELRTPISRIRFSLEMVHASGNEWERLHYLKEIGQDVDELDSLVSELLIYARFDLETPDLDQEDQLLAPWLADNVRAAEKELQQVVFTCHIAKDAQTIKARIAPRYMARALTNLIANAAKYAKQQVHVSLEKMDHNCLIIVDDDGPGIQETDRGRIFEPFVRIDSSRNRDTGGHGLGLAIVKRIVAMHRGRVWVESSSLGGARFTICWPMDSSESGAIHRNVKGETAESRNLSRLKRANICC
jgi:signal transduction histidine kinase